MRGFVVMGMFVVSLAQAGWGDYEEVRTLDVDAGDLGLLSIKAGAGSMDVRGVEGANTVAVRAKIVVPDADAQSAKRIMDKDMVLSLERSGNTAQLKAWFDEGFMGQDADAYIVLDVVVPTGTSVDIDDGSGSLDVIDVGGDVTIDDGSGSIEVRGVAHLKIDDGSGSIDVSEATGDVSIVDGSGSVTVKHIGGSVTIDDGSGSIRVSDVAKDLIIVDDGSGSLRYANVRGTVDAET